MTDSLINNGNDTDVVEMQNKQIVSMQLLQSIYNEITGKEESLSKSYHISHMTKFEDIKQLNIKILQLYEQYNIIANNCNVSLYHIDDSREIYSSFERFEIYNKSSISPIETVVLDYSFLIVLPKTRKAQSYQVTIYVNSRSALKQKENNKYKESGEIIEYVTKRTGYLHIEYVDYTVAKNFQNTIDDWFSSLAHNKSSSLIQKIKDEAYHFPFALSVLSAVFILMFFYKNYLKYIPDGSVDNSKLFLISLTCFGSVYIVGKFADFIGQSIYSSLRYLYPLSYLQLNRGDELAIEEHKKRNKKRIINSIINASVAIFLNIFAAYIATKLGIAS